MAALIQGSSALARRAKRSKWIVRPPLIRARIGERLLIWRGKISLGKGERRMSPEEQRSLDFGFLGLSLGLSFCLDISSTSLTSVSVLKRRTETKCLMKHGKKGDGAVFANVLERMAGAREERSQNTASHIFTKPFGNRDGDANSGTRQRPRKVSWRRACVEEVYLPLTFSVSCFVQALV